jgi:hypothetical protein
MARSPEWFERFPDILKRASEVQVPLLGQREIEALFGVSRRDAFRLLHKVGAREVGDTLTIRREDLVAQLEAIGAGDTYQAYLRRAGQVGEQLRIAREAAPARLMRLPIAKNPSTPTELPEGIRIQPLVPGQVGRVEIEFSTREDLWWKMAGLARARARDRRAIDRMLEPSGED